MRLLHDHVNEVLNSGASERCCPISRVEKVPETSKLGSRLPIARVIMRTSFKFKRSKIKVSRPTNSESGSALYLSHWNDYKLQTWYTVGSRTLVSSAIAMTPTLKGKVAMARGASDSRLPIN